ncbi:hypothetical protein ACLUXV_00165 [Limosilactobacillus reuteri subsp. suis]|uniref:Uncharacterized protein n=1 Tax=Limosilactobacillus reuteri TaxID=1598 RepID=A0ABD6XC19_LIMRT|nr:hypothetical protein [Limosilactobacillus reuteri]MCC4399689.1 hypothetical protein [Limosilactobacillus reuteri]MCC4404314.1 hypothetical protein [Limosilactobacillus reuteri]PTM27674.1 hypothetical protein DA797_03235 [Limosilactobacillus reuteri]PTM30249.1 hypothetical protein DA796_02120 [Limosilactobacillus reuteri]
MNLNSNYSLIVYRRKCPNYRGSGNYSIIGIAILPANKKISYRFADFVLCVDQPEFYTLEYASRINLKSKNTTILAKYSDYANLVNDWVEFKGLRNRLAKTLKQIKD